MKITFKYSKFKLNRNGADLNKYFLMLTIINFPLFWLLWKAMFSTWDIFIDYVKHMFHVDLINNKTPDTPWWDGRLAAFLFEQFKPLHWIIFCILIVRVEYFFINKIHPEWFGL